jgi:hypothetical protein
MSRNKARCAILALVLGASALGGCSSDMYLDRRDTVSFEAGDANAANKAIQTIDPWPVYAGDRNIPANGERMAAAGERYRTGKVYQPRGFGTSSVRVESSGTPPTP